jgi:hypothetical protein
VVVVVVVVVVIIIMIVNGVYRSHTLRQGCVLGDKIRQNIG